MLREVDFKTVYDSDSDNILEDFYIPALRQAKLYDRSVGFFSARTISLAAQGLSALIHNQGKVRLILGAFTDQEDIEAVSMGYKQKEIAEAVSNDFINIINEISDSLLQNRLEALAWMVSRGLLDIRIAIRQRGMFHEKVGIITDEVGDKIVFSGSGNDSEYALLPNYNFESFHVFQSWIPALEQHCEPDIQKFERLWNNRSPNTAVIDVPKAVKEKLLDVSKKIKKDPSASLEVSLWRRLKGEDIAVSSKPKVPEEINGQPFLIKRHQTEALNKWQSIGDYHGILALATGAGKTITAVYSIVRLADKIDGLTAIIAVPYQNLADQWCDVLSLFSIRPIRCYASKSIWLEDLQEAVHENSLGLRKFTAIVVVNRTLQSKEFQNGLQKLNGKKLLWIGDECHHHSSKNLNDSLPKQAFFRLGLSATPEHYMDTEKNARLESYYGKIVSEYSLTQAIEDKVLTPYYYHIVPVEFTSDEADEYLELSERINVAFTRLKDKDGLDDPFLQGMLMRRARIIGSAKNKLVALEQLLKDKAPVPHTLFYCGDGTVETDDIDENKEGESLAFETRQIEAVSALISKFDWHSSRFTSRESRKGRELILENFKQKVIDAMVAIRCLDEGIDVPACGTAYILASSRDPRQFIQRRGRILRRSPGKETATIFDFIVTLPPNYEEESGAMQKLLKSELSRVAEFSGLSLNRHEAYNTLRPILRRYDLEHLV